MPSVGDPDVVDPTLAPILLLAYKRPFTTLQTLYTLSRCPESSRSKLYVFCDGPRASSDEDGVHHTREVVRSTTWCGHVELVEATQNQGLAASVIAAVSHVCALHGRVIVLEDDLHLSRGFLHYMNESLRLYADDHRVMLISGHSFDAFVPESRAVFLPVATTWGWATWTRAWSRFQRDPEEPGRLKIPRFRRSFDLDGAFDYSGMLEAQLAGRIDSWGIRWWWTVHHYSGLGLFPLQSLVRNIGTGLDATHTVSGGPLLSSAAWHLDNEICVLPDQVIVDDAAFASWKNLLRAATTTRAARTQGTTKRLAELVQKLGSVIKRFERS